jgi:hypothetical protein
MFTIVLPGDFIADSFQWFFNGVALPGKTNSTLTIPMFLAEHTGGYSVEIRNGFGSLLTTETWVTEALKLNQTTNMINPGWEFEADARYRYEIQGSSNLQHWTAVRTYDETEGAVRFSPAAETNGNRQFFRVETFR